MKLQTQFTVPKKDLPIINHINKVKVLEATIIENVKITQLKKIV